MLRFLLAYAVALLLLAWINRREFRRHADKAARYKALPLAYKLACPFAVLPLIAATILHEGFLALGLLSFFLLESACVRWYRKAGLY